MIKKSLFHGVPLAADKKIYVVGDSTVCDYSAKPDNYYLQRFGYGTQLFDYLNLADKNQVVNLALSGRSSLSFLSESNYATLKNSIGAGDYLIIGFGHNDEKSADKARFTDPAADYRTASTLKAPSFQYTLYKHYVKLALDMGATPVLCTPIARYSDDGNYEGKSVVHVTADGDYAAAIKRLAADTGTAVVDLTKITKEYYTAHNADAKYFHAFTTYAGEKPAETPDGMDKTHLNKYGAKMIAYWLLNNLPDGCTLKSYVKGDAVPPTKDVDFKAAVNTAYVRPDYKGFIPSQHTENKLATTTVNNTTAEWFKTNKSGFAYSDGKFTIAADCFGAVFVQIDESKNFTSTAKAKVIASTAPKPNNQAAFGMMLRDDIYIDADNLCVTSNFVSASVTGGGKALMNRTCKTSLDFGGELAFAENAEYKLFVTRVGQVVDVTVNQGANTVTARFTDVSFVGVDNTKMYLCLFANRGLTVEFTDVSFEITGEAQGA